MKTVPGPRETISTLSSSKGITATILLPTSGTFSGIKIHAAIFQPKTQAVHVAWDGSAATTASLKLEVGDVLQLEGYERLSNFRVIEAAASATLLVMPEYRV